MRRPKGFTMIEMMVGLSVALIISSTIMDTYVLLKKTYQAAEAAGNLNRNARMAVSTVSRYLKMAGSGLARNLRSVNADLKNPCQYNGADGPPLELGTPGNSALHGPVIAAYTGVTGTGLGQGFGLLGDYVRPDSNFNGLSTFAQGEGYQRYAGGAAQNNCPAARAGELSSSNDHTNHTTIINELSGTCLAGSGCNTTASSLVLPSYGATCAVTGTGWSEPTCPWSLNKYRPSEYLFIVYPGQSKWLPRKLSDSAFSTPGGGGGGGGGSSPLHSHCGAGASPEQTRGVSLFYKQTWGCSGAGGGDEYLPVPVGAQDWFTEGAGQVSIVLPVNSSWISTLDRVFIRHNTNNRTLEFAMCWGPYARLDPKWQKVDSATPCVLGLSAGESVGTGTTANNWLDLVHNVDAFTITYYNASNGVVAAPGINDAAYPALETITRVGFTITLRQVSGSQTSTATESTSIQLRSRRLL